MGSSVSTIVNDAVARGQLSDQDLKSLRKATYSDGLVSDEEARYIFQANQSCKIDAVGWADFFVEALTDYIVTQQEPEGYITAESAAWLIEQVSADGIIHSKTELELLVNVVDKARWAPQSLATFALEQVKQAVISGGGPLRGGNTLDPGTITNGEVELLRRILYAFGGDDNIAVTRAEAEVLFEINDATASQPINAAWTELFCKAITNTLMAYSGYRAPSREAALRTEAWLESRGELSLSGIFNTIMTKGMDGLMQAYKEQSPEECALERLERQRIGIITNEEITPEEVTWLIDQLGRDGKLTPNEEALVDYITKESHKIHPKLMSFVEQLRVVA